MRAQIQKPNKVIHNKRMTKAKALLSTTALTACLMALAVQPASANDLAWTGFTTEHGSMSSSTNTPGETNITQHTATYIGASSNLSIPEDYSVNIAQLSSNSLFTAKAAANADPTRILGNLSANGKVIIIDNNGIFFGRNSRVDVAGMIATTGNIGNDQILNNDFGDYTIEGADTGSIELHGEINIADAGLAAFVAPTIVNSGIISARLGKVAFASGRKVTLDFYGDKLVEIEASDALIDAYIENTGEINVEGGVIQMTAMAAKNAVDNIINVEGVVTVASATVQGGKIILSGGTQGTVTVAGTVDASGENGGSIDVTGENVTITETASLKADGGTNGDGGDVVIVGEDAAIFRGSVSARGGTESGKGGFVETSGHDYISVAGGTVDTRAADGTAGLWLIDPTDITVVNDNGIGPIVVAGDTSTIGWTQILNALTTSNLAISTVSAGSGSGNITFDESANVVGDAGTQSRTLDFNAEGDIIVNDDISLSNIGATTLDAAGDIIFNENFTTHDTIADATVAGNLVVTAGNDVFVNSGAVVGVEEGSADVTLTAHNGNGGSSAIEIDGTVKAQDGKITLNADNYFVEVNSTGAITTADGDLEVNSNHGFDIDAGATVNLGAGNAAINTPTVHLGADIQTTGDITGTATNVDVENGNAQIQDGIDVAASGATVNVSAGIYNEDVIIDKSLALLGAGRDVTKVNGQSTAYYPTTLQINPNVTNVLVDGFTFEGPAGSRATATLRSGNDNIVISNNRFIAPDDGLAMENEGNISNITFDSNIFTSDADGTSKHLVYQNGDVSTSTSTNIDWIDNQFEGKASAGLTTEQEGGDITGNTFSGDFGSSLNISDVVGNVTGNDFTKDNDGLIQFSFGGDAANKATLTDDNTFTKWAEISAGTGEFAWSAKAGSLYGKIQAAVNKSGDNSTVTVSAGTFTENVTIDKSLDIAGSGVGSTIVNPEFDTTGTNTNTGTDAWWLVTAGNDVDISGITFDGAGKQVNYGLLYQGSGSVSDSEFKNIKYSKYNGRGVVAWGDGAVDVSNTTFSNIERIGTYYAGADVAGSIYADNTYTGKGDGDWLDYGIEIERGANNIQILRNTITGNTGVATDGSNSAGVLATTYFNPGVSAYLEGNVITGNTTAVAVGYNDTDTTVITAHDNDFSGNDKGVHVSSTTATADFSGNWWGFTDEADVAAYMGGDEPGSVDFTPFLMNGTDTDLGTNGFQGDHSNLFVSSLGEQTGATGRIQEGVDLAADGSLTGGDRLVQVGSGTFAESVTVNKALTLEGANAGKAGNDVTRGTETRVIHTDDIFKVTANNVTIDGFETFGGERGVEIFNVTDVTIQNNVIGHTSLEGIYGLLTGDVTFANNAISNTGGNAISLLGATGTNAITGNYLYGNNDDTAIHTSEADNLTVSGNVIDDFETGITASNSDWALITDNVMTSVENGVAADTVTAMTISNNNISGNSVTGIDVVGSNGASIYGNTLDHFTTGINIDTSTGTNTFDNTLTDVENGILLNASAGSTVYHNGITGRGTASGTGIGITDSAGSTIGGVPASLGNTISGFATGVDVATSADSFVDNNGISNVGVGVRIADSAETRARLNTISDASSYGVVVTGSNGARVNTNTIFNTGDDAINISGSDAVRAKRNVIYDVNGHAIAISGATNNVQIQDNKIGMNGAEVAQGVGNVTGQGINLDGSTGALISGNKVTETGDDGINVFGTTDANILNNIITAAGEDGIGIEGASGTQINDNQSTGSKNSGIETYQSSNSTITGNTIHSAGLIGIHSRQGTGTTLIDNNTINNTDSDSDGVNANNTAGLTVSNNKIGLLGGAYNIGGDGVEISSSNSASINNNKIKDTLGHGISISQSDNAVLDTNEITNTGVTGATVGPGIQGIYSIGSDNIQILANTITGASQRGVWVRDSDGALISSNNQIDQSGLQGISTYQVDNVTITDNTVTNSGAHGIAVVTTNKADISGNIITTAVHDGIFTLSYGGVSDITIDGNTVSDASRNGIWSNGASKATISNNIVHTTTEDGIRVDGVADAQITGNAVGFTDLAGTTPGTSGNIGDEGIDVNDSANAQVLNNKVTEAVSNGISLNPSPDSTVSGNEIYNVGGHGILVDGSTNVMVSGNFIGTDAAFTDYGTGNIGGDGVHLNNAVRSTVDNNDIIDTTANGVHVVNTDGTSYFPTDTDVDVTRNRITDAGTNGVLVDDSDYVVVGGINPSLRNTITGGQTGVRVNNSDHAWVGWNTISGQRGGVDGDGIALDGATNATITRNDIDDVGDEGIFGRNDLDGTVITWNNINLTGESFANDGSGIELTNVAGSVGITNNTVNNAGRHGIWSNNAQAGSSFTVDNNTVTNTDEKGIWIEQNASSVSGNVVYDTGLQGGNGNDGIEISFSDGVEVRNNKIGMNAAETTQGNNNIRGEGIDVNNSAGAQITDNKVTETISNGISINPSPNSLIANNVVTNFGNNANGIYVKESDNTNVYLNIVDGNGFGQTGILIENSSNVNVGDGPGGPNGNQRNQISDVVTAVRVLGGSNVEVDNNRIDRVVTGVAGNDVSNLRIYDNDIYSGGRNSGTTGVLINGGSNIDVGRLNDSNVIDGFRTGVSITGSTDADIEYNTIRNGDNGIYANGITTELDIHHNTLTNGLNPLDTTAVGINVINSNNVEIGNGDPLYGASNKLNGYQTSINVFGGSNVEVDNNLLTNTNYGIYADNVGGLNIEDNSIDDRTSNGRGNIGIYVEDSYDARIGGLDDSNTVEGFQTGIRVLRSESADVERNNVYGFSQYGINGSASAEIDVKRNIVHDGSGTAIRVAYSNDAEINNNDIDNVTEHGVLLVDSHNSDIIDNDIDNVGRHGIYVDPSDNVEIALNTIHDTGWDGIRVEYGNNAYVHNNHVGRTGHDGIDIYDNDGVRVHENYVHDTDEHGIVVSESYNADIRRNYIADAGQDGINLSNSAYADIRRNYVEWSTGDGIDVDNASNVDINDNHIHGTIYGAGIEVADSFDADIKRNRVHYTNENGIDVRTSFGTDIRNNTVHDTGDNGIYVQDSNWADVNDNTVYATGENGIYINSSDNADVKRNIINDTDEHGIKVNPSNFVNILSNRIHDAGWDGIRVDGGIFANINGNHVHRVGDDGIDVNGNYGVDIYGNIVKNTGLAWWSDDGNGIEVSNSFDADIQWNYIQFAGDDGIELDDSAFADIRHNNVRWSADNGIDVDNAYMVDVNDNHIHGTYFGDGISVVDSNNAGIRGNNVHGAGYDGIYVDNSDDVHIANNTVHDSYADGIGVYGGNNVTIDEINTVYDNGYDGIYVEGNYGDVLINDNVVYGNENDGIALYEVNNAYINGNTSYENGNDGVNVEYANHVEIRENTIRNNVDDGVDANWIGSTKTLIIANNNIHSNIDNGIEISNTLSTFILDNDIHNNGTHGLAVKGDNNGSVVLTGNTFTDNPIGALFESGVIDISDLGLDKENSFVNTVSGATPVGMQFDEVGTPGSLSLAGDTLGGTKFSGFQTIGSFYVRLEDGSFLNTVTGAPILINGLDATFDGINPSSTGGILSAANLSFIENRLYDADDSPFNERGQIFVGATLANIDNIEDFFDNFEGFDAGSGRLNVTITALPSVGPFGGATGAAALNLIAPAAGDGEEQTAEELANLEPAAGGEEVSCWSDAAGTAGNGTAVNYSFGGSLEDSIAAASSCGGGI